MRTNNLIQSYLENPSRTTVKYNSDNAKKNFNVHRELNNRTFIKPLPSNGRLVHNNIFYWPSEFFKDIKYTTKALKHAIKGNAKDHELGTLNDLGMKIGGLSIATYLFAMKQTPVTKLMEFVGFGTFFAAMNLWPKLSLQLPAYLVHGFNIRQEYRDNSGTKKPVFLDHQFIPWDLYTDEQINKIGDRMRVPKDMKNRRDFIQEKMRKIALQNNTMWMLTSGFATPIMSALLCDILQKPLHKYLAKRQDIKANNLLQNFQEEINKHDFTQKNNRLEILLEKNKGKSLTAELISEIAQNVSSGLDTITSESVLRDFNYLFGPNGYDVSKTNFEKLSESLKKTILKTVNDEELIKQIIPNADEIIEKIDNGDREALKMGHSRSNVVDFSEYIKAVLNSTDEKIQNYINTNPKNKNAKKIQFIIQQLFNSKNDQGELNLTKIFRLTPSGILTDENITKVKQINKVLNNFIAHQNVLDHYAYLKSALAPETSLANGWNKFMSDDILRIFNFTDKEIKSTRMDARLVHKLLRQRIEDIVADDTKYQSVVKTINKKLCELENITEFADFEKYNPNSQNAYKRCVDITYDKAFGDLKQLGLQFTPRRLNGYDVNREAGEIDVHTLKDLQMSFVQGRARGVKSSFYRILNTLDMFKRVVSTDYNNFFGNTMPKQAKEELVEMCKELLIGGHSSDYAVKFYFPRNTDLNPIFENEEQRSGFFGGLEIKDGHIINEYVDGKSAGKLADMPYDIDFYRKAMRMMYAQNLSDSTYNNIKDSTFYENFIKYRNEMFAFHGGDRYFMKPYHYADGKKIDSSCEFRFQLLGSSLDDMFTKLFSTKYNSKKWMGMFGTLGAALLGITVISQFFMGKMPSDKKNGGAK